MDVIKNISEQLKSGSKSISGVMIESFIVGGKQELSDKTELVFGQSITDPCLGWSETEEALEILSYAVKERTLSTSV